MKRGQIYYVDLSGTKGSEVNKVRPCIIVQNDVGNKFGNTTIVVPISHKSRKLLPTQVMISGENLEMGEVDGVAQCEQIRTVDKSRVSTHIGTLTLEAMQILSKALLVSLGL